MKYFTRYKHYMQFYYVCTSTSILMLLLSWLSKPLVFIATDDDVITVSLSAMAVSSLVLGGMFSVPGLLSHSILNLVTRGHVAKMLRCNWKRSKLMSTYSTQFNYFQCNRWRTRHRLTSFHFRTAPFTIKLWWVNTGDLYSKCNRTKPVRNSNSIRYVPFHSQA